jgi:hypothetical protein
MRRAATGQAESGEAGDQASPPRGRRKKTCAGCWRPISGKPDIGCGGAPGGAASGRQASQTCRIWARASRGRASQARSSGARNRCLASAGRGLANPWRLPALHFPTIGEMQKGIRANPRPSNNRAASSCPRERASSNHRSSRKTCGVGKLLDHLLSLSCHAREGGHPVITDLREKFAAFAITGSSAFPKLSCPRRRASSNHRSSRKVCGVCDYWIIRFRG